MNETLNINLEDYDLIPVLGVTVNEQQHVLDIEVDTVHRFEAKNPHSGLSSISHNSARMATKYWKDRDVLEFADIKREGFLKSANNSILVDAEFWELVRNPSNRTPWAVHARRVFAAATEAAYHDNTGEPGFINVDKLTWSDEGTETITADNYIDAYYAGNVISVHRKTKEMIAYLLEKAKQKKYKVIVNPCCVSGDTRILTDKGHIRIDKCVGKKVSVWNGYQWSTVTPFSVGVHPTLVVHLSDGSKLQCTHNHKFVVMSAKGGYRGKEERVEARALKIGSKLWKYEMPVVSAGKDYGIEEAYSQGFYSGDGSTDLETSYLYEPKYVCESRLIGSVTEIDNTGGRKGWIHGQMRDKYWVPIRGSQEYCLNWLAGILDSDGSVTRDVNGNGLQIANTNKPFLVKIRLMLTRLGVRAKVVKMHDERLTMMPDGRGGMKEYLCKPVWRLLIGNMDTYSLVKLGLRFQRLDVHDQPPQRDARQFVTVVSVEKGSKCENFCFEEPINHTGTFNGIVTGQSEIPIAVWGAYCIIGDVCGTYARTTDEFKQACVLMARALMRVNLMRSMYSAEVKRTMRIGVGMIGIFEFAWNHFQINMHEILLADLAVDHPKVVAATATDPDVYQRSLAFASFIDSCGRAVEASATEYAQEIGVNTPHTFLTLKPAGCLNPETVIKTSEGPLSLRQLFTEHGVDIEAYQNASHLWFEPTKESFVYDQNNELKRVTRLFINGDSQTVKLTMQDGSIMQCTPHHKVLTSNRSWVAASELGLDDDIVQF